MGGWREALALAERSGRLERNRAASLPGRWLDERSSGVRRHQTLSAGTTRVCATSHVPSDGAQRGSRSPEAGERCRYARALSLRVQPQCRRSARRSDSFRRARRHKCGYGADALCLRATSGLSLAIRGRRARGLPVTLCRTGKPAGPGDCAGRLHLAAKTATAACRSYLAPRAVALPKRCALLSERRRVERCGSRRRTDQPLWWRPRTFRISGSGATPATAISVSKNGRATAIRRISPATYSKSRRCLSWRRARAAGIVHPSPTKPRAHPLAGRRKPDR